MKILITGITGTLGRQVLSMLLENSRIEIYGISRDEQKQRAIPRHPNLHLRVGDIRDSDTMAELFNDMEYVNFIYHFAALKCVDTLESWPMEAVRTNILGTQNVLLFAKKVMCNKVIFTSTDKAVYPINAYGHSKAIAEKMVLNASPTNVVCRYGNILGSRGSFLPSLVKTLKEKKCAYITDQAMTRFWMTIEEVATFVVHCGETQSLTGLQIPKKMYSSSVLDLVQAVAEIIGVKDYEIKNVGIRPGEKIHESIQTKEEEALTNYTHSNECLMTKKKLKELLSGLVSQ